MRRFNPKLGLFLCRSFTPNLRRCLWREQSPSRHQNAAFRDTGHLITRKLPMTV